MPVIPTLKIVDKSGEFSDVNLLRINSNGGVMSLVTEGSGMAEIVPHFRDRHLRSAEDQLVLDNYAVNIKEGDTDTLATATRRLFLMLRKAWQYKNKSRFKVNGPIYLQEQARCETNPRYAMISHSPTVNLFRPHANMAFEQAGVLADTSIQIAREIWRDNIPGDMPANALTLTQAESAEQVMTRRSHIANFWDDEDLTYIYVDDGGAFGANLVASTSFAYWPAAGVVDDAIYFGADKPFRHVILNVGTVAVWTGVTIVAEISEGGGVWQTLTEAAFEVSEFDETSITSLFLNTGIKSINLHPAGVDSWATQLINGQTLYWLRLRINAMATWTTTPEQDDQAVYTLKTPYIEIPAASIEGDASPFVQMRFHKAAGGNQAPSSLNTSLVIVGARSRELDDFRSYLNLGEAYGGMGFTLSYGDDTSGGVDDSEAPGGERADCDFAGETASVMRVRLTGADLFETYIGEFRPFLVCQQISGSADELFVKLRIRMRGDNDYDPQIDTDEVALQGPDFGLELVDLTPGDFIKIPFTDIENEDYLTDLDLLFEVHARQDSGSATIRFYALVLIPVDEWSCEYRDPITNSDFGSSALRGLVALFEDGGMISDRTLVMLADAAPWADRDYWPIETWYRRGPAPWLDPARTHRLYFLMGNFPEGQSWGDKPFLAELGPYLHTEVFSHNVYHFMRGDD